MNLLTIRDLSIQIQTKSHQKLVVDRLNLDIPENSIVGLAGESGSGKTLTALSILRLMEKNATIQSGSISWARNTEYQDLTKLSEEEIRKYRGKEIAMIFQEPLSALNPVLTCGFQASEGLVAHRFGSSTEIKTRILDCFTKVGLQEPERIYQSYPFQLSGGQLQRVLIAIAIANKPKLIIADEPTTALDVSLQKHIIQLLKDLKKELQLSILFISHDLGIIKNFCDKIVILNQGRIIESGTVDEVFNNPKQAYTKGLLNCRPPLKHKLQKLRTIDDFLNNNLTEDQIIHDDLNTFNNSELPEVTKLICVSNLTISYIQSRGVFSKRINKYKAVSEVNFTINEGETLGLVGESGSGKTSIGRAILNLIKIDSGEIWYKNRQLNQLSNAEWRPLRKDIQIVFQDPYSSLNPKQTVGNALLEPLEIHNIYSNLAQRIDYSHYLLKTVGLTSEYFTRYPHQLSGGQRQRICIARALSVQPKFIICDEPVSALDVSIQAQILNLLKELKVKFGLSYLFISHDLSVINFISDRIAVMQNGKIIEQGTSNEIINNPKSDYTKNLIASIPS